MDKRKFSQMAVARCSVNCLLCHRNNKDDTHVGLTTRTVKHHHNLFGDDIIDFVYLHAVCKTINKVALKPEILRLIKFKNVSPMDHTERFYHIDGLLSKCAQVRNPDAQAVMSVAVLFGGAPLWEKMKENRLTCLSIRCATSLPISERRGIAKSLITGSIADLPYIMFSLEDKPELCEPYEQLRHLRLVGIMMCCGKLEDIMKLSSNLKDFLEFFLGYHKYTRKGKPIAEAVLEIYGEDKLPTGSVPYISQIVSAIFDQLKQEA